MSTPAERAAKERLEQGLPEEVEDPATLARIARIIRDSTAADRAEPPEPSWDRWQGLEDFPPSITDLGAQT